jgi:hypothetical protein
MSEAVWWLMCDDGAPRETAHALVAIGHHPSLSSDAVRMQPIPSSAIAYAPDIFPQWGWIRIIVIRTSGGNDDGTEWETILNDQSFDQSNMRW